VVNRRILRFQRSAKSYISHTQESSLLDFPLRTHAFSHYDVNFVRSCLGPRREPKKNLGKSPTRHPHNFFGIRVCAGQREPMTEGDMERRPGMTTHGAGHGGLPTEGPNGWLSGRQEHPLCACKVSLSAIYPLFLGHFKCFDLIFIWTSKRIVNTGTL
jgi:hypothetical protein